MAPMRVGLIGLGAGGNQYTIAWGVNGHLRSIQALPGFEIVAVANSTVESAQRSIEFHKLPGATKAYGNPEDIAADPNVDLVVVAVKVSQHFFLAKPALEHKKPVFVEWPLGVNLTQAEELTKLASSNGVKTIVGLQARADPLVQKLKEIIASGKIGQVISSTATSCTSHIPLVLGKGTEYFGDFKAGANEFSVVFGHFLDSFTYVLGDFSQVQGLLKTHYKTIPVFDTTNGQLVDPAYPKTVPDHIFVQGTLENDALASITFRKAKAAADKMGTRWYITGTEGEIVVTTEEGNWQYSTPYERSIKIRTDKETEVEEIAFAKDTSPAAKAPFPATNTARLYENFLQGNGEFATFESALKTHHLLERIVKSAGWEL